MDMKDFLMYGVQAGAQHRYDIIYNRKETNETKFA